MDRAGAVACGPLRGRWPVDRFAVGGQSFALEAVGVYEIDSDGLIEFFRDYYDQSAIVAQLEAAGFHVA